MARDDWYRRSEWSEQDAAEFFKRLARARSPSNKAQYLLCQAQHLLQAGKALPAISLVERQLREFPDKIWKSSAHTTLAECYVELDNPMDAVLNYRHALRAEEEFPHSYGTAWLDYPILVLKKQMVELYVEIGDVLVSRNPEMFLTFPMCHYKWEAAMAFLNEHQSNTSGARKHAQKALKAMGRTSSGFRYHQGLGLVTSPIEGIHDRLVQLASDS